MKAMNTTNIFVARTREIRLLFLLVFLMLMDLGISLELLQWLGVETITRL